MPDSSVVIVTGIEHSGTSLLARLLLQHPDLAGGFEGGLLLAPEPARFPEIDPWYEWMMDAIEAGHWGVPESLVHRICEAGTWEGAYAAIRATSPLFTSAHQRLLDKTPAYQGCLDQVLGKAPAGTPCLIIEKSPANLWRSFRKRTTFAEFEGRFRRFQVNLRRAASTHGASIVRIQHESLCCDLAGELARAFHVIGLDDSPAFAREAGAIRSRFESDSAVGLPAPEADQVRALADGLGIDPGHL